MWILEDKAHTYDEYGHDNDDNDDDDDENEGGKKMYRILNHVCLLFAPVSALCV